MFAVAGFVIIAMFSWNLVLGFMNIKKRAFISAVIVGVSIAVASIFGLDPGPREAISITATISSIAGYFILIYMNNRLDRGDH